MTITFTSRSLNDGVSKIEVGYPFIDFTSFGEDKVYYLNLTEENQEDDQATD